MTGKTYEYTRTINYKLETVPTIRRGLKAYRLSCNDSSNPDVKPTNGLCLSKDIKSLRIGNGASFHDWKLVKPKLLESLRLWGWAGKDNKYTHFSYVYDDTFNAVKRGRGKLVRLDNSAHMCYDENNKVLPVAIYFDYISARMNNGSYRMDRLLEILKERSDIHFIKDDILPVPYYNASPNNSSYVEFLWQPSVDDYRLMWNKCKKYGSKYPSTKRYEAIFELDLLGLRKGGAALFDTFYKSIEDKYYEE